MAEEPEASALTARRAAQHFRLSSADDACEHLYILTARSRLGPSPPNAGRYTVASRFRCRSCERGYIFPRAPEQFVASPLCLVGYVRWDARSDRVPPLQTIIFSSFPGRTKGCRLLDQNTVSRFPDRRFLLETEIVSEGLSPVYRCGLRCGSSLNNERAHHVAKLPSRNRWPYTAATATELASLWQTARVANCGAVALWRGRSSS